MLYILHENEEWLHGLLKQLQKYNCQYVLWFVNDGINGNPIDFSKPPPDGIFYNRASCSSHTRNHDYSIIYMQQMLYWLESHGRRVINGSKAFQLELSKTIQYITLLKEGFQTPSTTTLTTPQNIINYNTEYPFMLKDNQGGSGSGVYYIKSRENLVSHLETISYPISPDRLTIIQKRIDSPSNRIYRVECIDGNHLYTLSVDTTGGFNLCPASACQMENCPLKGGAGSNKFKIIENPHPELLKKYLEFSKKYELDIVAFEYIVDEFGTCWTYDINCNTNYNDEAEETWGQPNYAYMALIKFLETQVSINLNQFNKLNSI